MTVDAIAGLTGFGLRTTNGDLNSCNTVRKGTNERLECLGAQKFASLRDLLLYNDGRYQILIKVQASESI